MVGGQPGAGKTAATVQAVRELMRHGGGVAYINGDELQIRSTGFAVLATAPFTAGLGNVTSNNIRFFWIEHQVTVGAVPGYVRVVVGTTAIRPAPVAGNSIYLADIGFTSQISNLYFAGPLELDHIRVSTALLGSSPP